MAKLSKRTQAIRAKVKPNTSYVLDEALKLVKETANAKFDESIDVAVVLGIDAKKSDQAVRGDVVGFDDLAARVKGGFMDFDVVIASPDAMRVVGQLGQILGPRGLMPNPKVGTVTPDVALAVKNAKAGQVQFRADKAGIVHCTVGRASFDAGRLKTNIAALVEALNKAKPASSKGIYLKKVALSSTMGIGVRIDPASLTAQS